MTFAAKHKLLVAYSGAQCVAVMVRRLAQSKGHINEAPLHRRGVRAIP